VYLNTVVNQTTVTVHAGDKFVEYHHFAELIFFYLFLFDLFDCLSLLVFTLMLIYVYYYVHLHLNLW